MCMYLVQQFNVMPAAEHLRISPFYLFTNM